VNLPGTLYLIDTSAAARMTAHPSIRETIESLIDNNVAASCVTLDLEAGYSVREPHDVARVHKQRMARFIPLPITDGIAERARELQGVMAERGLHRAAGAFDLLTAAVAEHYGAILLHYDADFQHIADVGALRQKWIVPRGSID
jgi:predicted nucleic acid-binding protein